MQNEVDHEQVGIRLANQLATAMYKNAVLETLVEQLKSSNAQPATQMTEGDGDDRV